VASSELGAAAARAALADAGMEASEIDYIVCATMTPDHYCPGAGTAIQERLGIAPVPALDIRQQCAGFAYGLQLVDALIRSGVARNVLLVGTDVHTTLMPFSRQAWAVLLGEEEGPISDEEREFLSRFRHLVVLFGDAAGAMVFSAEENAEGRGILGSALYGDGANKEILYVPGAGSLQRPWIDVEMIRRGDTVPVMEGRQVFRLAVTRMPEVTRDLLGRHGYTLDDLDLLVMHQANLRINEAAQKALGLADDKVHNNVQRYGNTTSATLPLCFHEARAVGKAPPGSLVAFAALGAGLHWGAVLLRV
jgi:3-oxoacyl-[acyl-carrier-protein] synthase-3